MKEGTPLVTILTICLYCGKRSWNVPKNSKEQFSEYPTEILEKMTDWRYQLIEIREMNPEQISDVRRRD